MWSSAPAQQTSASHAPATRDHHLFMPHTTDAQLQRHGATHAHVDKPDACQYIFALQKHLPFPAEATLLMSLNTHGIINS